MYNYISLLYDLLSAPPYILLGKTLKFDLSQNDFPILTLRPIDTNEITTNHSGILVPMNGKLNACYHYDCLDAYDDLPYEICSCALSVFRRAKKSNFISGDLIIIVSKLTIDNIDGARFMLRKWPKVSPKILLEDDGIKFSLAGYNPHY